jgi:hypothetical protein
MSEPDATPRHTEDSARIDGRMSVASFDGSFAPLVRPSGHRRVPWYRDREYFLGGWLDPSIWKAAVSSALHGYSYSYTNCSHAREPGLLVALLKVQLRC